MSSYPTKESNLIWFYLLKADFFSENISLNFNESKRLNSCTGISLTLLVIISGLCLALIFGRDMYDRKNPTVSESNLIVRDSIVQVKDLFYMFNIKANNGSSYLNLDKYIKLRGVSFEIVNSVTKNIAYYNIKYELCNEKHFDVLEEKYDMSLISKNDYIGTNYCILLPDDIEIYNPYGNSNSISYSIEFIPCYEQISSTINDNTDSCPSNVYEVLSKFNIDVKFLDNFVESLDFSNPVKYFINSFSSQITRLILKTTFISLINVEFISDNAWLFETSESIFFSSYIGRETQFTGINDGSVLYTLTFETPQTIRKYYRKYLKLQDLFAKVGGFINGLIILMRILTVDFFEYSYLINVNELIKKERVKMKNNEIISENKKEQGFIKNNDNKQCNSEFYISKDNENGENNNANYNSNNYDCNIDAQNKMIFNNMNNIRHSNEGNCLNSIIKIDKGRVKYEVQKSNDTANNIYPNYRNKRINSNNKIDKNNCKKMAFTSSKHKRRYSNSNKMKNKITQNIGNIKSSNLIDNISNKYNNIRSIINSSDNVADYNVSPDMYREKQKYNTTMNIKYSQMNLADSNKKKLLYNKEKYDLTVKKSYDINSIRDNIYANNPRGNDNSNNSYISNINNSNLFKISNTYTFTFNNKRKFGSSIIANKINKISNTNKSNIRDISNNALFNKKNIALNHRVNDNIKMKIDNTNSKQNTTESCLLSNIKNRDSSNERNLYTNDNSITNSNSNRIKSFNILNKLNDAKSFNTDYVLNNLNMNSFTPINHSLRKNSNIYHKNQININNKGNNIKSILERDMSSLKGYRESSTFKKNFIYKQNNKLEEEIYDEEENRNNRIIDFNDAGDFQEKQYSEIESERKENESNCSIRNHYIKTNNYIFNTNTKTQSYPKTSSNNKIESDEDQNQSSKNIIIKNYNNLLNKPSKPLQKDSMIKINDIYNNSTSNKNNTLTNNYNKLTSKNFIMSKLINLDNDIIIEDLYNISSSLWSYIKYRFSYLFCCFEFKKKKIINNIKERIFYFTSLDKDIKYKLSKQYE